MRRAPDPDVETCEHGYPIAASRSDCARCADRPIAAPIETRFPQTRWHGTDTTLGPAIKIVVTLALVVPLVFMVYEMRFAHQRPMLTFLIVPVSGLLVFAVQFLPVLWEPGGRSSKPAPAAPDSLRG